MPLLHIQAVRRAILNGRFSKDVGRKIKDGLRIFLVEAALFDRPDLRGSAKQAELVVKLGYWVAKGQLTESEFRFWVDCIPAEDNIGWDVVLLAGQAGPNSRPILKMGPLDSEPEACLVQEPLEAPPP